MGSRLIKWKRRKMIRGTKKRKVGDKETEEEDNEERK
jgi:hypothetical protein